MAEPGKEKAQADGSDLGQAKYVDDGDIKNIAQGGANVKQEDPVSKQILDILYPEPEELTLNNSPLWFTVWTVPKKESVHLPVTKINNVPAAINPWVDDRHIYFGPGLRDQNLGRWKAGSNQHIAGIPGIWDDIDIKGPGHKEENLPTTLEEAISLAYSIPELPPTLIIFSGGGIYAIWLFKEVWILEDESEQNEAQNLLKRFEQTIINQGHSRGWNIDSVADLRHVIRLPGTNNLKDPDNPKQVTILEYHPDRRYNPDDFEPYLAEIESTPIYTTLSSDEDFPLADANKILENCPWMKHCQDDASSLPEPEWYAMLTIIARCENGREWAHYLSSPYPGYSELETDKKHKQASERCGPNTCEYIQKRLNPSFCQNCTKKVTSPVMLGRNNMFENINEQKDQDDNSASKIESIPKDNLFWCAESDQEGDARLLVQSLRNKYIYDHALGSWNIFNGVNWVEDRELNIINEINHITDLYSKEAQRANWRKQQAIKSQNKEEEQRAKYIEDIYLKKIKRLQNANYRKGVLELARAGKDRLSTSGQNWDSDPYLLACENGIIDLRSGEIREGDPKDMIKVAAPIEYKGLSEPCPNWLQFLNDVFCEDPELIEFVQRILGYSLIGQSIEHILIILWGIGRNGKGVLLDVLNYVLGPLAGSVQPELLLEQSRNKSSSGPSPDIMALKGKRLVWASETNETRKLDVGRVKMLVGGDILTGRSPWGKYEINFEPSHTLFLLTNHKPKVDPDDYALWQRLILIPFQVSFVDNPTSNFEKQRDSDIATRLKDEAPGILAWLVQGCLKWQQEGLNPPEIVQAAVKEYRESEDILGYFIEDCCFIAEHAQVKSSKLYEVYQEWCRNMGHKPMSGTRFGKKMIERFDRYRNANGWHYIGIGIAEHEL